MWEWFLSLTAELYVLPQGHYSGWCIRTVSLHTTNYPNMYLSKGISMEASQLILRILTWVCLTIQGFWQHFFMKSFWHHFDIIDVINIDLLEGFWYWKLMAGWGLWQRNMFSIRIPWVNWCAAFTLRGTSFINTCCCTYTESLWMYLIAQKYYLCKVIFSEYITHLCITITTENMYNALACLCVTF